MMLTLWQTAFAVLIAFGVGFAVGGLSVRSAERRASENRRVTHDEIHWI